MIIALDKGHPINRLRNRVLARSPLRNLGRGNNKKKQQWGGEEEDYPRRVFTTSTTVYDVIPSGGGLFIIIINHSPTSVYHRDRVQLPAALALITR
jgi:hypothetical protein